MKPYLLLILSVTLFCASTTCAQMRQLSLDLTDEENELQNFSFYSPTEGYAAFRKWIGFTSDSGRNFIQKPITSNNVNYNGYSVNLTFGFSIKGANAFNKDTLVVYGDYGLVPTILFSIDQGNSFTIVYHDQYDPFAFKTGITDLIFPQNKNIGYAVDADRILKSTNKGLSWSVVRIDVNRYYDYVQAVDNNDVFALSVQNSTQKLVRTSNGGSSWAELALPPGYLVFAHFLTASKGWIIMRNSAQQSVMYYTSNSGASWEQKNDPVATPINSRKFFFVNDSTGYATSSQFQTLKTTDSGKVWQPLPRDNRFYHLNYSHNDLQILNETQLWAGGGHGFVEISTNGGGNPLPQAFFKVDTTGMSASGQVNLRNYSKPFYQYKWFANDTLISTSYHASFTHNRNKFLDTISLVVSDGTHHDTLIQYVSYPAVSISGFTPSSAGRNNKVTITGYNLSGTRAVSFGGVSASSFTVISNTEIQAVVGNGASGKVEVFAPLGTASMGGFSFLGLPRGNLPTAISDNVLCKSERIEVTLQNTETGVLYELTGPGLGEILGSVTGNGGMVRFVTVPISQSKELRMRATRIGDDLSVPFNSSIYIKVEQTRAVFEADLVNITLGESVSFAGLERDSKDYYWKFQQDASIATATGTRVTGVSYQSTGQKTLQLISVSSDGCRDTIQSNAVFVYPATISEQGCFINPMDSTSMSGMAMGRVVKSHDDGLYLIGATDDASKLRSRIGVAKEFRTGSHNFFAKYTRDGVLKWVHYFTPNGGTFTSAQTDPQGNIYLTGDALSTQSIHFNNGDSLRIYVYGADTTSVGQRRHGFIMKLNPEGKYLWHTVLYDHTVLWQGYPSGAIPTQIAVKDNHIVVLGKFLAKLSYVRNGVVQQVYDYPGSSYWRVNHNYSVLKIKDDGALLWNAELRFVANNSHSIADPTIDKAGNIYLAGTYEQSLDIYDAVGVEKIKFFNTVGHNRAFMVSYDPSGKIKWHNHLMSRTETGDARLATIVADDLGNTYLTGSTVGYDGATMQIIHSDGSFTNENVTTFAIFKFDANGKRRWAVGSRYYNPGSAGALCINRNEVFVVGNGSNPREEQFSFTLSSTDGNSPTVSVGQAEPFIVRYDTAGKFKQVYRSGYKPLMRELSLSSLYTNSIGQLIIGGYADLYSPGSVGKIFGVAWPNPINGDDDGFFMKMNPDFCQSSLIANAGPDRSSCAGDTVSIGGTSRGDSYFWTSTLDGFFSNLSNPVVRPKINTIYYLKVTNQDGATAYDTVSVTVKQAPFVDAGRDTTICAGQHLIIGTPALSGYSYQWISSANDLIETEQAQISVYPAENTIYYLRVLASNNCASSDTVNVTTLRKENTAVTIETPNTTVCNQTSVLFTSNAQNIGSGATYEWQVNGKFIGATNEKYNTDSLQNGDKVTLLVTHDNPCASASTILSNSITVTVVENVDAAITISGNTTINEKELTKINTTVIGGGTDFKLRWQDSTSLHDWQDLPTPSLVGIYDYKPLTTGDKIRCVLTVSDLCGNSNVYYSNALSFTINIVTAIDPVPASYAGLRYYPNPVNNTLFIDSLRIQDQWQQLEITSIDGRQAFPQMNAHNLNSIQVPVTSLRSGVYIAILRNRRGLAVYLKFVKL